MKGGPRIRELAARVCSSRATDMVDYPWLHWNDIADAHGASLRARDLAWAAFDASPFLRFHEAWADAEAMLRTGWAPR